MDTLLPQPILVMTENSWYHIYIQNTNHMYSNQYILLIMLDYEIDEILI